MKFNRKEHSRFVQWLDRTAEKNPILWLPCVVLLVIALGAENICGIVRVAFPNRERVCASDSKTVVQLARKPFALRVVAMSLVLALGFMTVPELGGVISVDVFADDTNDLTLGYSGNDEFVFLINSTDDPTVKSGKCGDNVFWILDNDGTLTISGTGKMYNQNKNYNPEYKEYAKKVIISEGVTEIGSYVFSHCYNITDITMTNSVDSIGKCAFYYCTSLKNIVLSDNITIIPRII